MTLTMKQWQAKVKKWVKKHPQTVEKALKEEMLYLVGDVQKVHLSGPKMSWGKGSTRHATLARQTARLARSIHGEVIRRARKIRAYLGSNVIYARIHEKGGTIEPRNAPYLAFTAGGKFFQLKKVKMPKRPYLWPTVERNKKHILATIHRWIVGAYGRQRA